MEQKISFDSWFEELMFEAEMVGMFNEVTQENKESWRDHYDNGDTPNIALHNDTMAGL